MSEEKPHAQSEVHFEKGFSVAFVEEGKWAYDIAARKFHIAGHEKFNNQLVASNIILRSGDKCVLHNGIITVSREGKKLGDFIMNEWMAHTKKEYQEAKIITTLETRKKIVNLQKNTQKTTSQKNISKTVPTKKETFIVSKPNRLVNKPVIVGGKKNPEKKENPYSDKLILKSAKEMEIAFELWTKLLMKIIDRESWFDPNSVSPAWAHGLMQVRHTVCTDMKGRYNEKWSIQIGRGIWRYLRLFKKVPRSIIDRIAKNEARKSIQKIQKMSENDRVPFQKAINILQENITDPHINIIIGGIYLASILDDVEETPNIRTIVKNIDIDRVNELLIAKNKKTITPVALQNFAKKIIKNPSFQKKFIALAIYNEGSNPEKIHWYDYATVILIN